MKIALLGDIAFNGIISLHPEVNHKRYVEISQILAKCELVFSNLEIPAGAHEQIKEFKNFIHFASPEVTRNMLKLLNIRCVSLANNHIFDFKMGGLKTTLDILDKLGIYHTGAGWELRHIEPVIIEKNGYKIAFLAYVDKSTNIKTELFPEILINYFDSRKVISDVEKVKKKVDKVICSIHWGKDYSYYPTIEQVNISRELISAGVNIIMGHHPHTIQPFEKYKNGYIFYSLGGLTFGDFYWEGKLRAIKRKTKQSFIPVFDNITSTPRFITTREVEGNYIRITNRNIRKWSDRKMKFTHAIHNSHILRLWIRFNESVIDRFLEFFTGYYRNPLNDLISMHNIKKIRYIFRDLKK